MQECYKCSEVNEDLNCCAVPLAVELMSSRLPLNICFVLNLICMLCDHSSAKSKVKLLRM